MRSIFFATVLVLSPFSSSFGAAEAQSSKFSTRTLTQQITAIQDSAEPNLFQIGMLQSLLAIEATLQTRYRFGLGASLRNLPLLRLPLPGPTNPDPEPFEGQVITDLMTDFLQGMSVAQTSLNAELPHYADAFELTLQDIWFDIDQNGIRTNEEGAIELLAPRLMSRRDLRDMKKRGAFEKPMTVRFDSADHAWLTAYTHLLSGFANIVLAYDPAPVIDTLDARRKNAFDKPTSLAKKDPDLAQLSANLRDADEAFRAAKETRVLAEERYADLEKRMFSIQDKLINENRTDEDIADAMKDLRKYVTQVQFAKTRMEDAKKEEAQSIFDATDAREAFEKELTKRPVTPKDPSANFLDPIYIALTALAQEPDATHITAAMTHWKSMILQNRLFWRLLSLESDNEREWIPNPNQRSVFGIRISEAMANAWQDVLDDADDLLEGERLIPHPLFPEGYGISLSAFANDPGPINLIESIHGIGAYEYAVQGERVSNASWRRFRRMTSGNQIGFAIFLN